MRKLRFTGFIFVTALLVASCGGGSDANKGAAGTTVPAPTTTVAPAPSTSAAPPTTDPRADRAAAAVLQLADFPPGYSLQPPDQGLYIDLVWQDIIRCLGVESVAQPAATATSETFLKDIATQARTRVDYVSAEAQQAIAAALASPQVDQCLTDAFTADAVRSAPDGATPGPSVVSPLDVPQAGDQTLAWRINLTVNLGDLQIPIYQDFMVVFKDGTVIPMFFLNPGSPFPRALEASLVDTVVSRA